MNTHVKTWLGIIIIIIITATIGYFLYYLIGKDETPAESTVPIQKTKPKACTEEAKICTDGSTVVRTGPNCEFAPCPEIVGIEDKIIITSPKPGDQILNPVSVSGKARGTWFFEGSLPVNVYDSNNKLLGRGYASFVPSREGEEWMTEDFVNFSGSVTYENSETETGYILFKKDNPSDLRQFDESYSLPVKFSYISTGDEGTSDWKTYENSTYGFSFKYPDAYKETQDTYGYPNAVIMLVAVGPAQSYSLVVEVWDTKTAFKDKYNTEPDLIEKVGNKYITLWNMNDEEEIDDVIDTFEIIN